MRRAATVSLIAATAVGVLWTASRDDPPARTQPPIVQRAVEAINRHRLAHGLSRLRSTPGLTRAAKRWSVVLSSKGSLFHTTRLRGRFAWAGETLYRGPGGPVRAWLNSPPHRAIILSERARLVGIGRTGDIWVGRFGAK